MKDEDKNKELAKHLETGCIEIPTEHRVDIDTIVAVIPCLICEERIPVSRWEWEGSHAKICEKCKKAVLKLRKMFDEEACNNIIEGE